jgi:hypothetical protein
MHLFNTSTKSNSYSPVKTHNVNMGEFGDLDMISPMTKKSPRSHLAIDGANQSNRSYSLIFRLIHEPLPDNKKICILGRIPELSNWDKS